mmetsp:Transcript_30111/g.70048  ORF Transcript_30111/g.70048 Transcript_30111/m.70048 type:complete len:1545 (+) Transcript_30111:66-4700(+)
MRLPVSLVLRVCGLLVLKSFADSAEAANCEEGDCGSSEVAAPSMLMVRRAVSRQTASIVEDKEEPEPDVGPVKMQTYKSVCPESHPWAYRPTAGLDYCCQYPDNNRGVEGINSLPDKDARSDNCKWNRFSRCPSKPCADYGEFAPAEGAGTWYYLDHFPGTPARCGVAGHIECASEDGEGCLWGSFGGATAAYEAILGVPSTVKSIQVACPGWPTKDGTDACVALGCHGNATTVSEEPSAEVGKCGKLILPGFAVPATCENLGPGESCEVGCPEGMQGFSSTYTCYSALAANGLAPAAARQPACYTTPNYYFPQAGEVHLQWKEHQGCLQCSAWRKCTLVEDFAAGDGECTAVNFVKEADEPFYRFRTTSGNQCLQLSGWIDIPGIGLWGCGESAVQRWLPEPSAEWPGVWQFCASEYWRGKVCVVSAGLPSRYANLKPTAALVQPALTALTSGDEQTFLKQAYAMQTCKAKIESGVPKSFFTWLQTQNKTLVQSLFATFPVMPGQVKMFHEIREAVGHAEFESLGMEAFAVALSYINRYKPDIDLNVQVPHPIYERNNNGFTGERSSVVEEELKQGARHHNPSCGGWENWNFSWPRSPSPTIRQWVEYWKTSIQERGDSLWENPLQQVPWHFGVYLWPSPLEECEWVRRVLIDGESFEGGWYKYTFGYYDNICAGDGPYGDSLMGIAEYGGVCDRMAELEWRKSSCMGMPAQQKSEPGHWAGFKFGSTTAKFVMLNVLTDWSNTYTLQLVPEVHHWVTIEWALGETAFPNVSSLCVKCSSWNSCSTMPAGHDECTNFEIDLEAKRIRAPWGNQCLDMFGGPQPGLWGCSGGSKANQDFTVNDEGHLVITSSRGTIRMRSFDVPQDPHVPACLACKSTSSRCEFDAPNSTECTQFIHDDEAKVFRARGQCVDMFSGPDPGLWSCNGGSNQALSLTDDGYQQISSSRGTLTFSQFAVGVDQSEFGRCLVCDRSWNECSFTTAGAEECTEFRYDEETKQLRVSFGNQCVQLIYGRAKLWGCHSADSVDDNQKAEVLDGKLVISWSGDKLQLVVPNGGLLPETTTRWDANFFHVVDCQRGNCNYPSALTLDSKLMFDWRHGEAAMAAAEAYNNYESQGIWPTAHDEARLAASMVFTLRSAGIVSDSELEPALAWALRRNPGLYDAWELAAEFPANGALNSSEQPHRDDLPSRKWFNTLSLLRVGEAKNQAHRDAADRFAREHLLPDKWGQMPQLRQNLVGRLCGALSEGLLQELGDASAQCLLVRRLANGLGWAEVKDDMLEQDVLGSGNLPSDAFMLHWEAVARLAVSQGHFGQVDNVVDAVEHLLQHLSVGYYNQRGETFFSEHKRVVLRGPYAHMLQLAAKLMPKAKREALLESTKKILEKPWETPDRLLASPPELLNKFLEWVAYQRPDQTGVREFAAVVDAVDGFLPGDNPSPDVMQEMILDRDEEMEQGADSEHSTWSDEGDGAKERYDVVKLLQRLLDLEETGEESGEEKSPEDMSEEEVLLRQEESQARLLRVQKAAVEVRTKATDVMQMCVDDLLSAT